MHRASRPAGRHRFSRSTPYILLAIAAVLTAVAPTQEALAQSSSLGIFEEHGDIGAVKKAGSAQYDAATQEYVLTGSGKNMWLNEDEFHFLWKRLTGDFVVRATLRFVGKGVDLHRKIGWMVRNSQDSHSAYVDAVVHGDGLTSLQFRRSAGALTEEVPSPVTAPAIIQMERRGNTYTLSTAEVGGALVASSSVDLTLQDQVLVGLVICSHNADVLEKAVFSQVEVITPN